MSSSSIYLHSESDGLRFIVEDGNAGEEQAIWIRTRLTGQATVALTLSRADRAKLRAALDQADAIADKGVPHG